MTIIWCYKCGKTNFNTPERDPTQDDVLKHLEEFCNTPDARQNEELHRHNQDTEWQSRREAIQRQMDEIDQRRSADFADFAANASTRELPGNAAAGAATVAAQAKAAEEEAEQKRYDNLLATMRKLMDIHDDSDDEGEDEDEESGAGPAAGTSVVGGGFFGKGPAYAQSDRWHQGGRKRQATRAALDNPAFVPSLEDAMRKKEDKGATEAADDDGRIEEVE